MKASVGIQHVLLALSTLSRAMSALSQGGVAPCLARAWVRAPDLAPGQVIQGDVRVKLNGSCDDVASYSIGLRFAERSWVKTRREGVKLPENPSLASEMLISTPMPSMSSNDSVFDGDSFSWRYWNRPQVDASAWEKYENEMKDPALWLVREEERIGFETLHVFSRGESLSHDMTGSFALLIPSTNYPPAFDQVMSSLSGSDTDIADAEHIYTYYVDVTFVNGTQQQILAGYTSFDAIPSQDFVFGQETMKVPANRQSWDDQASQTEGVTPEDNFILEVTFPNGRHLEQGSVHNLTIISHQLGPGLQRPLSISWVDTYIRQNRTWAAGHAVDDETAETLLNSGSVYEYQLRPKLDDKFLNRRRYSWETGFEMPRFSQAGVVENGTAFATESVTVCVEVPPFYPTFDMYYQSSEVDLLLSLDVRNVSSKETYALPGDIHIEEDEYDWTPTLRQQGSYPTANELQVRIPLFVHRKLGSEERGMLEAIHYLSPEARAPVFVDPASVTELLQKTPRDRDSLAPFAQARFVTPADGNVVKNRYYGTWSNRPAGLRYVGDTWLRKVVNGQNKDILEQGSKLVIQK